MSRAALVGLLVLFAISMGCEGGPTEYTPIALPADRRIESPLYDPAGPDRDCEDFPSWSEAHAFFTFAGGPERDPHRLDADRDGVPCEALR